MSAGGFARSRVLIATGVTVVLLLAIPVLMAVVVPVASGGAETTHVPLLRLVTGLHAIVMAGTFVLCVAARGRGLYLGLGALWVFTALLGAVMWPILLGLEPSPGNALAYGAYPIPALLTAAAAGRLTRFVLRRVDSTFALFTALSGGALGLVSAALVNGRMLAAGMGSSMPATAPWGVQLVRGALVGLVTGLASYMWWRVGDGTGAEAAGPGLEGDTSRAA